MPILSLLLLPLVSRYLLELAFSSAGHVGSPYGPVGSVKPCPRVRLAYEVALNIMHTERIIVKGAGGGPLRASAI
jgi:hypothetical protein